MKKSICFILMGIFIFSTAFLRAQENKKEEIPVGMEILRIGPAKFIVPKDTKVHKKGDLVILESANEYVARKVEEIEERIQKIVANEKELSEKIEQLNKTLNEIKKKLNSYDEKVE